MAADEAPDTRVDGSAATGKPRGRSGSQTRKASEQIKINCTPAQKAQILAIADAQGQSPAALCLNALLGTPLPPRRAAKINYGLMAKFLAANATSVDALKERDGHAGKAENNLNQVAHQLNAGAAPMRIINIVETALEEVRAERQHIRDAIRDIQELRTAGLQALGEERLPKEGEQP